MIALVAPCVTNRDRQYVRQRIDDGLLEDETEVRRFEEAFAERAGCAGAVAVCSGTAALELALRVLDVQAVSIPTYSCVALANSTRHLTTNYMDCNFDVSEARGATLRMSTDRARIITHLFGRPDEHRLDATIEDYTLSLGGIQSLWAPLGVCSTHASKMISTGRGGVVFGNDLGLLYRIRRIAYYDDPGGLYAYWRYGPLAARIDNDHKTSLGMSAMQAALGVSQLEQLDAFIARRREIANLYSTRFTAAGIECPDIGGVHSGIDTQAYSGPAENSVFFRYLIGVNDPAGKIAQLAERGIEAGRGVYPPLHRLAGLPDDDFPGATACVNRLLSVPCHPSISDKQAAFIAEQVVQVCSP